VSLSVSPIRDEYGQVVGASKVARDITPARQATEALRIVEERLRDQHRELLHAARLGEMGQMAATLAHEISQPLSAIVSYLQACELLLDDDLAENRARLREALGRASRQAGRAGEVLRRLRAFSKPHDELMTPVSITQILEESVALAALGSGRRDVLLDVTPPTGPDLVVADKVEIQQVLLNLIRNAIEAMEGQSRRVVRLCTRADPDEFQVAVGDTGPGLSPRARDALFQPFFTTKKDGMGIGLSICRKIINLHGGRLWAEDRTGGGTIFWFTLRRAKSI
jgi:two-component system sensor kinase FixL